MLKENKKILRNNKIFKVNAIVVVKVKRLFSLEELFFMETSHSNFINFRNNFSGFISFLCMPLYLIRRPPGRLSEITIIRTDYREIQVSL